MTAALELMRMFVIQGYNYEHSVLDGARIEPLAVLPRIPVSEGSHGPTRHSIAASSDCTGRRAALLKSCG